MLYLESLNLRFLQLRSLFVLLPLYRFLFLQWKPTPRKIYNCSAIPCSNVFQRAVVFNDKITIEQILNEYTNDHSIRTIHIYDSKHHTLLRKVLNYQVRLQF